ncbi:MAG: hypothetical protein ACKV19_18800 [Verrucomicrobiales bacterium]
MKTNLIYSSLTTPQRLRAMVSAFTRSDTEELERLVNSAADPCRAKSRTAHHFSDLGSLAAFHNSWLLEQLTIWLLAQAFSPEERATLPAEEWQNIYIAVKSALDGAATIEAAFAQELACVGITAAEWRTFRERLLDAHTSDLIQLFLTRATTAPDQAQLQGYAQAIRPRLSWPA